MTGLNTKNNYSCTMKYVAWKCNGQVAQDKLWRKMSLLTCQTMNLLKVHRTLSAPEDVKSAKFLQIKTRLNWHAGSMMTTAMSCTWTVTLITDVDVSQSPAVDWVQPTTCLNPPEPCRLWPVNSRQLNIISTSQSLLPATMKSHHNTQSPSMQPSHKVIVIKQCYGIVSSSLSL